MIFEVCKINLILLIISFFKLEFGRKILSFCNFLKKNIVIFKIIINIYFGLGMLDDLSSVEF